MGTIPSNSLQSPVRRLIRAMKRTPSATAWGHRWTIHGCPVCLTLSVGDLRFPGHRSGLLVNRYVPLAVAVLAPVSVNILSFHALMAPSGLPLALFVAVLWAVIFVDVRPAFAGLFQARLQARA